MLGFRTAKGFYVPLQVWFGAVAARTERALAEVHVIVAFFFRYHTPMNTR
jgi:hypothetical protein